MKLKNLIVGCVLGIFAYSTLPSQAADPVQIGDDIAATVDSLLPSKPADQISEVPSADPVTNESPSDISTTKTGAPVSPIKPQIRVLTAPAANPSGYSPQQMRRAYGFDQLTQDGTGQTIAIVDAYGNSTMQKDLDAFCTQYGIPSTTITFAYPSGKPSGSDSGWALETALDVEWAHAIAPGATILLVVSKDASFANMYAAVDYAATNGANQVSMSWGAMEYSGCTNDDSHFKVSNVAFTASSGDNSENVLYPASSPYVIAVGGTTLNLDSAGNRISETAWGDGGGGVSIYEPMPPAQQSYYPTFGQYDLYHHRWYTYLGVAPHKSWLYGYTNSTVAVTNSFRQVPDVSYNADPSTGVAVYQNGTWIEVGGTSAGAPQWAALFARVNSARATAISNPDVPLYQLGARNISASYFNDIIAGSNGGGITATNGFDEVTGLGTPISNNLVPALIAK